MTRAEYDRYLRASHWQRYRRVTRYKRGQACEDCGITEEMALRYYGKTLQIHHLTYENLGRERSEDVLLLCPRCHSLRHGGKRFDRMAGKIVREEVGWPAYDQRNQLGRSDIANRGCYELEEQERNWERILYGLDDVPF
jgi:hypothetical protein